MPANKKSSLVRIDGKSLLVPFILITSLFFLWGCAHSLLDVLNKHFQEILSISKAKSGYVQAALYGGYFIMAIPAGLFMKRFGYRKGIILGLLLYAAGAFLFYPSSQIQSFASFLGSLFIIACGLACLETAANPYTTVLGPKETAERRINLSQSFNGLGWVFGPLVGGWIIFGNDGGDQFASVAKPYLYIGGVVCLVSVLFYFTRLPEIEPESETVTEAHASFKDLLRYPHFMLAVLAQFLYVAAQTGVNSFFINYVTETVPSISNETASRILAFGGMGLFFLGRISGSFVMQWFRPNRILAVYGAINVIMMLIVVGGFGWVSFLALFINYFCMSIMFPTIFSLGIKDLGPLTKKASSLLVMAIVGGAVCPVFMGYIADVSSMRMGFIIPACCFVFVFLYGLRWYKMKPVISR